MKVHDIEAVANDHHDGDLVAAIESLAKIAGPYSFSSNNEYVSSKMVVAWWAAARSRKLPAGMTVNAVSPGSVPGTNFGRNASWMVRLLMVPMMKIMGPLMGMAGSIETAAARYVVAADFGNDETGHFYASENRKKLVGPLAIQEWPGYFSDRPSQEAGFQVVINLKNVPFPDSVNDQKA